MSGPAAIAAASDLVRLDVALVRRGVARSRDDAAELIAAGAVTVSGRLALKPSIRIPTGAEVVIERARPAYVSRGAHKLAGALADFTPAGLTVAGRRCMDVGASTGGFTQVLLNAGAASVVAVDVGTGQLAPAIAADARVEVHDGVNARELAVDVVGTSDLIAVDLSFISLRLVLPALTACLVAGGDMVAMVKPQFEVGRGGLDSRGVVREPAARLTAISDVAAAASAGGLGTRSVAASRLPGPAGNVEYFLWLRRDAPAPEPAALRAAVDGGPL